MTTPAQKSTFLSLAPAVSASYPQPKKAAPGTAAPSQKQRRTSSMSSDGSKGPRILKLGPVHGGEHLDEHNKGDWHEEAVE